MLKEPIKKIWNKKRIDEFRDLKWIRQPCKSCPFLHYCACGCKVDLTCSNKYCVDYAVRENKEELIDLNGLKELLKIFFKEEDYFKNIPETYRNFVVNKYTKLNLEHKEKYLVTRYQTIVLDRMAIKIIKEILKGIDSEGDLINKFSDEVERKELRLFINKLIKVEAIDLE